MKSFFFNLLFMPSLRAVVHEIDCSSVQDVEEWIKGILILTHDILC